MTVSEDSETIDSGQLTIKLWKVPDSGDFWKRKKNKRDQKEKAGKEQAGNFLCINNSIFLISN
jgi:hypothetical protein